MKKRFCLLFSLLFACVCLNLTLTACGEDEHIHTPNSAVRENEVLSTCTAVGSYDEVVYCADCGEEIIRTTKTIEKFSHTSSDWITDAEATCEVEGKKHKECTVCHAKLETDKIDKLTTHTPANAVRENEVNAKCDAVGSYDEVVYCSVCDTELSREEKEIAKLPHTEAIDLAKAPSCTETGLTEGKHCSVCNEVLVAQEVVKANGHTDDNNDFSCDICTTDLCTEHKEEKIPAVAATCTETGLTEGKKCSICGDILVAQDIVKANGHSYVVENTDSTYFATAADCENAATYFYSCACGDKGTTTFAYGEPNGHNYTEKNTGSKYLDKAADCENAATYFYSCACGDKGTTTFAYGEPNGHNFAIEKVDIKYQHTPATEYSAAIYYKSCACGKASTTETFTYGDMLPGYLTYKLSDDSSYYIVTGYVGAQTEISVPHLHDGLPVFVIMEGAFRDNTYIQSITMPNSIQVIGSYAFANCTALESIIIPTSVIDISPYTFSGCTALETITLHSGIDVLGDYAFEKCSALKSITLNEGLKTISDNAFDYCTALESILIPDTVTTLGNMAFRHAESLETVKFSKALKSIGNATFQYCVKLDSIELHENIDTLGNSTFSYCDGLKSIRILGNLTTIGHSTFYECRSLDTIYYASNTPGDCGDSNYIFYNAGINGEGIVLTIAKDAVIPDGFFTPYVEDNMPKITKIVVEDGTTRVSFAKNYNKLPYLAEIIYPSTVTDSCYGAFNNSPWWDNQDFGEVFINGIFYGYKCHCYMATPEEPVTENYCDPTCTEDGSYDSVIYCEVCNDELSRKQSVILKKGHDYVDHEAKAVSCTDIGWDAYKTCSRCDYTSYEEIEALGHDYIDHGAKAVSCTDIGWDAYQTCSRCDYTSYGEITALGHDYIEHEAKAATCTDIGWDAYQTCSRCDYTSYGEITALGHDYIDHGAKAVSCTDIGWDAYQTCSRCDYTSYGEITALGHDYIEHEAKAATCTDIGWDAYQTCSRCDYTSYEETEALGHDYVNHSAKDATCTEIGWYEYDTCSRCSYSTYEEIAKLGHDHVNHEAKVATCTDIGWNAYQTCSRCDYTSYQEIDALGHDYIYREIKAATCVSEGERHHICTVCEMVFGVEIIPINYEAHNFSQKWTSDNTHHWNVCQNDSCEVINEKFEHNFGEWIIWSQATCTRTGSQYHICADCQKYRFDTIPINSDAHNFSDEWTTDDAYHWYACNNGCNFKKDQASHSWNEDNICTVCCKYKNDGFVFALLKDGTYRITDYFGVESEIVIPSTHQGIAITSIDYGAFESCESIKSIIIPDGITRIDGYAFKNCTNLTSITISNSVTQLGSPDPFSGCTKLASIKVNEGNTNYKSVDGNLYTKDEKTLIKYAVGKADTSFTVPDDVTNIAGAAFSDCTTITSVVIPNSVTYIGSSAFRACTSITDLVIPDSVTSIDGWAFYGCTSLMSIKISYNVISLDSNTFAGCTSLTNISLPGRLQTIGFYVFMDCTSLTTITIPNNVRAIDYGSFKGCTSLTSIDIPNKVTTIESDMFRDCINLVNVTIGTGVTSIGDDAFRGCKSLKSITVPDNVKSFGYGVFYGCSSLESITLPFVGKSKKNLTDSDQYPFGTIFGTSNFDGSVPTMQRYYVSSTSTAYNTYYIPKSLKHVTITGGDILYGAFYNCSNIETITLLDKVTAIGDYAFYGCSGLSSISIPNGVMQIGSYSFENCSTLTSITIPYSVNAVGYSTFYGCTALTNITFADTYSTWYRTNSYSKWESKTDGTKTSLSNVSTNATYFKLTYYKYYWYKL